jgi:hypothetical protein
MAIVCKRIETICSSLRSLMERGYLGTNFYDDILRTDKEGLPKAIKRAKKTIEKGAKFLNKIGTQELTPINTLKGIPKNATIRPKYIDCGKSDCKWNYGHYYYAYWKDEKGRLKKKYVSKYRPEINISEDSSKG